MGAGTVHLSNPLGLAYLEHLRTMAEEFEAAMQAVTSNALVSFEQSVSRQKDMCTGLVHLTGQMQKHARSYADKAALGDEGQLAKQIVEAEKSLIYVTELYAAFLQHTSDSARLFASLCGSYSGHFHQGTETPRGAGRHALSCEL